MPCGGMTARSFSMRGPSAPTLLLFVGFRVLLDGHWCIASAIEDQTNVCSAIALRSRHGYEMALWISICDLIFSEPLDNGNAKITPKCVSVVSQVRMTVIICRYSGCIFWMSICVFVCFDHETSLRFGGRPRWTAPQRHLTRHILGACRTLSSFLHAPQDPEVCCKRGVLMLGYIFATLHLQGNTKHLPLSYSATHQCSSIAPTSWTPVKSKSSLCSRSSQAPSLPSQNSSRMSRRRSELTCARGQNQQMANGTGGSSSASLVYYSSSCSSACLSLQSMSGMRTTLPTPPAECPLKHSSCRNVRMPETASTI